MNFIKRDIENIKAAMLFLIVGVYGCLFDIINGEKNLLPEFFSFTSLLKDKFDFITPETTVGGTTINGAFILFIALGSMLLATTMSGLRGKYTIRGYIKIIILKCKLKYYTGILEKERWKNIR